jgi:hypothetical protein
MTNGADFDPATLHDWPSVSEELVIRACAWADSPGEQRTDRGMGPTRH